MDTTGHAGPAYDPDALTRKYAEERAKRIRRDGEGQYREAAGEFASFAAHDPNVEPGFTRERVSEEVDVAVIGGGFGGLLTAAELRGRRVNSLKIVEQGGDFGGTWYWNRYPGVRCDIEAYIYLPLLEEVGTVPSERYVEGREILAHCQAIGRKFGLYEQTLFQTKVTSITWDDTASRWVIATSRGDSLQARFVTVSQGPLAKIKLPGIPGIDRFQGKMFHSSRWDFAYTGGDASGGQTGLAGKNVAVIGTGATGIQIVPRLSEHAGHVYMFQRTPSAVAARNNTPTDLDWFKSQPVGWQRARMANFLSIISGKPQPENMVDDGWTDFWSRFIDEMAQARRAGGQASPHDVMQRVDFTKMTEIRDRVAAIVEDEATARALQPWYNYLCKRPLFSDDFLQTINKPNVTLVDTAGRGVERITETGIVACGREHPIDCIIFATGFDVGATADKAGGYALIGRGGVSLEQKWAGGVRSVHGTQVAGFPNFHIVGGVAQGTIAFNYTHVLQMQAIHAAELVARCLRDGTRTMEVTEEAEARWLAELNEKHVDHQHFYEACTPGFLNNEGDVQDRPTFIGAAYGGGAIEYGAVIEDWRERGLHADVATTRSLPLSDVDDHAAGSQEARPQTVPG